MQRFLVVFPVLLSAVDWGPLVVMIQSLWATLSLCVQAMLAVLVVIFVGVHVVLKDLTRVRRRRQRGETQVGA